MPTFYDRLGDSTLTTGTGSITLSGTAPAGYQNFSVVGNGNTVIYLLVDSSNQWEVGLGTFSSTGPTLARTTVYSSSNSNSLITLASGTTVVRGPDSAHFLNSLPTGSGTSNNLAVWTGTETLSTSVITDNGTSLTLPAAGASSFTTSSGALTLTGGGASTWSTTAGALTIQGWAGLNLASVVFNNNVVITSASNSAINITAGNSPATAGVQGATSTTTGGMGASGGLLGLPGSQGGTWQIFGGPGGQAASPGTGNAGPGGIGSISGGLGGDCSAFGSGGGTGDAGAGGIGELSGGIGGRGSSTLSCGAGGSAVVIGGSAGALNGNTAGANGGNVTIDGGPASGTGSPGTVNIGPTNSNAVNIGNSGSTTTITGGTLTLDAPTVDVGDTLATTINVGNSGSTTAFSGTVTGLPDTSPNLTDFQTLLIQQLDVMGVPMAAEVVQGGLPFLIQLLNILNPGAPTMPLVYTPGTNFSLSVGTAAVQGNTALCNVGVQIVAAAANTGKVYVGFNPGVTAAASSATDGFELVASAGIFLPVANANLLYFIGSAASQEVFVITQ